MAEKYISSLKVSDVDYDISAASAASLNPEFDLAWSNVSGLTATSAATGTSGIMTPEQIQLLVAQKAGEINVYTTAADTSEVTAGNTIYLIKDETVSGADKYNEYIYVEDEGAVKIGDTSVDLSDYYNKAETNNQISSYVESWATSATSEDVPALWTEVTDYVSEEITEAISGMTATSAALWNETYEVVSTNSDIWTEAYDAVSGAVKTSADMSVAGNADKLAQVGAITSYVEAKIAEEIAETIDIASKIEDSTSTSAIPNVGALTGYVEEKIENLSGDYLEKQDVFVTGTMLVINNL